jgi:hypothetical protein
VLELDDELRISEEHGYGCYWRATHDMVDALNHQTSVAVAFLYLAELSEDPVAESVRRNVLRSEEEINARIAAEFEPLEDHPHWLAELPQLVPYVVLGRADPELEAQLVDLVADRKELGGWFAEPTMLAAYASRLR